MTEADLIYAALLRAAKRLESEMGKPENAKVHESMLGAFVAVETIREEIGNGLAKGRVG